MNQVQNPSGFRSLGEEDADYLHDESRLSGCADSIAFPGCGDDLRACLAAAAGRDVPVTFQGARTGITGGAVPDGGAIINFSRMNRILAARRGPDGGISLVVEPGLTLQELNRRLAIRDLVIDEPDAATRDLIGVLRDGPALFFAPDPTETGASLGGMVSCNASGACSFRYGATRRHVGGLTVVLPDAQTLSVRRGSERGRNRRFSLKTREGRLLEGELPVYRLPSVKNAAGYYVDVDMDLVDLWIGAEGTLGAVAAVEVRLLPAPALRWGLTAFFPGDAEAMRFVRAARGEQDGENGAQRIKPAAIEYFDTRVLRLIEAGRASNETLQQELPAIPDRAAAAIYLEIHAADENQALEFMERMAPEIADCGGDDASTWIADGDTGLERLHRFRHAAPELVNLRIDEYRRHTPSLTKLGTDMAVPAPFLEKALAMFHADPAGSGLDYVIFGHVGDNHFHVNILPASLDQYAAGKAIYSQWARQVIDWGGTVSAEHGIGKLKTAFLAEMLGREGIAGMRTVRTLFDPDRRCNRGNLFG